MVGLGNPGKRYAGTRHNVGFRVVERLAGRWGVTADEHTLGALVGVGSFAGGRVALARPQSFMNRSGQPVRSLVGVYGVEEVVVVHDDMDLDFGRVQLKRGGGHGGHNGLRDLHVHVGPELCRVRMGVGRPAEGVDPADHVLGEWTADEALGLDEFVDRGADAVEIVLQEGMTRAMNRVNVRTRKPAETQQMGDNNAASNEE